MIFSGRSRIFSRGGGGGASIKQQHCTETDILEQLCTGCKEPLRLRLVNVDIQGGYITNS